MSIQQWNTVRARKYNRDFERKKLEAHFNAEIVRRRQAGQSKEEIIADLLRAPLDYEAPITPNK